MRTQPGHLSVGRRYEYQRKLDVNRHTARCTSPVSVVSQCKLVSGRGLRKRRSAPPFYPCGSGRTFTFLFSFLRQNLLAYCFEPLVQSIDIVSVY